MTQGIWLACPSCGKQAWSCDEGAEGWCTAAVHSSKTFAMRPLTRAAVNRRAQKRRSDGRPVEKVG